MTALMYAAGSLDRGPLTTEVVKALITAKADIGARTPNGETALDLAVRYNKTNVVSILKAAAER
jgi:ankyrin repeat protein